MKNLRSLYFLALFMAATTSFTQNKSGYEVKGEVKGLPDGTKIFLIDGGRRKVIDSTIANKNRFLLKGKLSEPAHMYLHAGSGINTIKLADILLDNQAVQVKGSKPEYDSVTVSGSNIDSAFKEWLREDQAIGYLRYKIKQVVESLVLKQDTVNASAMKEITDQMQQQRIILLKSYVKRYYNSPVGASLPTQCTLEDYLTKTDYMEMYTVLAPAWQRSRFGKEILEIANCKSE